MHSKRNLRIQLLLITQFLPASDAAGQNVPIPQTEQEHLLGAPTNRDEVPSGHGVHAGVIPAPTFEKAPAGQGPEPALDAVPSRQ